MASGKGEQGKRSLFVRSGNLFHFPGAVSAPQSGISLCGGSLHDLRFHSGQNRDPVGPGFCGRRNPGFLPPSVWAGPTCCAGPALVLAATANRQRFLRSHGGVAIARAPAWPVPCHAPPVAKADGPAGDGGEIRSPVGYNSRGTCKAGSCLSDSRRESGVSIPNFDSHGCLFLLGNPLPAVPGGFPIGSLSNCSRVAGRGIAEQVRKGH